MGSLTKKKSAKKASPSKARKPSPAPKTTKSAARAKAPGKTTAKKAAPKPAKAAKGASGGGVKAKKAASGTVKEPERSAPPLAEVDAEVLEFIAAIDRFKQENGRPFPSWSEVLLIVRDLGYRRTAK